MDKQRKRRRVYLLCFVLCSLTFIVATAINVVAEKRTSVTSIGMIPLLAAPQQYDGRRIQTWGYLHIGRMPEQDSLWLRKEDGDAALLKNSFALDLSTEQRRAFACVNNTYVIVNGVLRSEGAASSRMDSGTITGITHLSGWSPFRPTPCAEGQ